MIGSSSVRSCLVASFLLLLALSQIDMCAAKSLDIEDDYWPTSLSSSKRNSWWSKKSLDSTSDYNRLLKDSTEEGIKVDGTELADLEFGRDAISELYGCYIGTCVPEFVRCAQQSKGPRTALTRLGLTDRSDHLTFSQCRRNHQLCGLECRVKSADNTYV